MKKMILLAIIFITVVFTAGAVAVPELITFNAKNGNVSFFHIQHTGITCADCHHTEDFAKCSDCHNTKVPNGDFHKFCIECHKGNSMATSCASCHKR